MRKRLLSALLALCILLTLLSNAVYAAGSNGRFTDVSDDAWYSSAVRYVHERGMMLGTSDTEFSPNGCTSRGMIVTILHRLEGTPHASGAVFADVPEGQWYTDAVTWAGANGIVKGYDNGDFGPNDPISREQLATILYRYTEYSGYDTETAGSVAAFTDGGQTSSWAVGGMNWAIGTGLISGTDNNALVPGGSADRAQTAAILMRFCENVIPAAPEAPFGEIGYKAPSKDDIAVGVIEYKGRTYTADYVKNQLIAVFADGTGRDRAEALAASYGACVVGMIETAGLYQLEFNSARTLAELNAVMAELRAETDVEDAYLNTVVESGDTAAPYYPADGWDTAAGWDELHPKGNNWGAEAINAPSAWALLIGQYGSIYDVPGVRVGIIDSYFDMTHEDLRDNLKGVYWYQDLLNVFSKNQIGSTAAERAAKAGNFSDFEKTVHGSHVAGIIGARFNNGGMNGIAINPELYGASLGDVTDDTYIDSEGGKVIFTRFGISAALSGLIEDSRCKVINYSIGYKKYDPDKAEDDGEKIAQVLRRYLDDGHEFLIAASAGNDRARDAQYNSIFTAVADEEVKSRIIVVGSTELLDGRVLFYDNVNGKGQSSGGRVDVLAPGANIYSTVPQNGRDFKDGKGNVIYKANSSYTQITGTSMAAPHVAGVAALVWAAKPSLTGARVKDIIRGTANLYVEGSPLGMVNAAYAVSMALGVPYTVEGTCGSGLTWTLEAWSLRDRDGTLTVRGNGKITTDAGLGPWHRYRDVIQTVKIGDGVTEICDGLFSDYSALESVEFGSSVSRIGGYAFANCVHLSALSVFPASLAYVGEGAFNGIGQKDLYFAGDPLDPEAVTGASEAGASFAYSKYCDTDKITLYYPEDRRDRWDPDGDGFWEGYHVMPNTIVVSGGVIDDQTDLPVENVLVQIRKQGEDTVYRTATDKNGKFTVSIPGPAPATLIVELSAEGYKSKNVLRPDVEAASQWPAFRLEPGGSIPVTVTVVNEKGKGLPGLTVNGTGIYPAPVTGPDGSAAFQLPAGSYELTVTDGTTTARRMLTVGDSPVKLELVLTNGAYLRWDFDKETGKLTVWGNGPMPNWTYSYSVPGQPWSAPWASCGSGNIRVVEVMEGITSIGAYAFYNCRNLSRVDLPDSLTDIGSCAFESCESLTGIDLPDGLTNIGRRAFCGCTGLSGIDLPDGLTGIAEETFMACISLSRIDLPDGLTSIGNSAFGRCSMSGIDLPDGLTSIGEYAFARCSDLSGISLPDGVTSIRCGVFSGCGSLTGIELPDGLTDIGDYAFDGCESLTGIDLPGGLTGIGAYAFRNCYGLTGIDFPAGITNIGGYAFRDCRSISAIRFSGDAPLIASDAFSGVTANAYYPANNATWTPDKVKSYNGHVMSYGGRLTWIPW